MTPNAPSWLRSRVQRALADLNARNAATGAPELAVRIGLESGPVVTDAAGEVFGEAPNIAARVQAAAEPGTVLVTSTVQRQVAGLFLVEDKGAHQLKGAPAPVSLYRIVRVSGGHRRKGARLLTPFIGREEDLGALARASERALRGTGSSFLSLAIPASASPGSLKNFADISARRRTRGSNGVRRNSCRTRRSIRRWGGRAHRFGGPEVAPERRLAELEFVLADAKLDAAKHAALLAPLIDIPIRLERLPNLSSDEIPRKQLAAMVEWALASARVQPIVLVLEDLQWFDPTSIALVQALSERGAQAPLLILATARPEFRPPWSLRPHHKVISLAPLDEAQVQRMIAELLSQRTLSADVIKRMSERAGGVPLFIEEVTRLILERGEGGGAKAIPPTLRQSLAARLDRLGSAREVAQIGAVLGRSFSYRLLRDVAVHPETGDLGGLGGAASRGFDEDSLKFALASLVDADLLFADGVPPEATYRFKHALIQGRGLRQPFEEPPADVAQTRGGGAHRAQSEPEAIAHHFTAAGAEDMAIEWWGNAGDEALRRSAFKEAISHLGRAIAMADESERRTPGREAGDRVLSERRLRLHTDYGHAAMWLKGFAADEMSAAYARASKFAGPADEAAPRFVAYYGECLRSFMRGEHRQAHAEAEAFLREAEAEGRPTEAGVARRVLGFVSLQLGDLQEARKVLERALGDYVHERDRDTLFRFGNDTQVSATNFLALTEWHLGEFERARRLIDELTRRANELGHAASVASALFFKTAHRKPPRR